MKVWTILSPDEIRVVAHDLGVKIHSDWNGSGIRKDGRAWNFRLALGDEKRDKNRKYQRVSSSAWAGERRVAAVCWHGHRDFMRAVFAQDPNARFKTAVADYKGSEHFEQIFPATGHRNVGSMMYPAFAKDVCTCSHDEWDVDSSIGGSYAVSMQQSMIRACPHVIFMPDHYRADGSCKCNEKDNSDMKEWGYTWSETQKVWT